MSIRTRPVSEVMQTQVFSLAASDRLDMVEDVMRLGRVRHMPVLEDERLVGVLSHRDLLAASLTKALQFEEGHRRVFMRSVDVGEVMSKDVVTVEPSATLEEAARLMRRHQIGCLPVVKPDRVLVGLVTETDLLEASLLSEEPEAESSDE